MEIFNLLNTYTSEAGSWSIEYNDHKITYSEPAKHYVSADDDGDELDGINTRQDIYRLYWFNDTPVGYYCILANSIEELEEKVIDLIKEENLIKYNNKEKMKKCEISTDEEQSIDELSGAIAGLFLFYGISTEKGVGKLITNLLKKVEKQLIYKTQKCKYLEKHLDIADENLKEAIKTTCYDCSSKVCKENRILSNKLFNKIIERDELRKIIDKVGCK